MVVRRARRSGPVVLGGALLCAALVAAVATPLAGRATTAPRVTAAVPAPSAAPGTAVPADARRRPARIPVGLHAEAIAVDGVRRSYLESVPAGLHGQVPLVIAFHGLGETAAGFARQSGLVAATTAAREVLVLPQSVGRAFNDGRFGPHGPRDDAFAMALIARFTGSGLVDPERVTVAGFSNGAGMAMQVADAHPDRVAAVVAIDGEMIKGSYAPRPTGAVEAVLVHGTADRVQPWLGRRRWGHDLPAYVSVMATVDAWVRADGCGRRNVTDPGPHPARSSRLSLHLVAPPGVVAPVTAYRWSPGRTGAGVTFYRIAGMGHRWPVTQATAVGSGDQLAGVSATAIIVRTALTATREGRRTVLT